jgi:cobalt-zinc-cadmium efflux system protein
MFSALALNILIAVSQIIGGILSGSLSLISDSFHNMSDAVSLLLSYLALRLKLKNNSQQHTFGFTRAEILAAFINSAVLVGIAIYLFYAAGKRLFNPEQIEPGIMGIAAFIGLVGNAAGTLLLSKDSKHSINIKSSYLHLLSDAVSSAAVIFGALAIYFWRAYWIDPVLTILIGFYILKECYSIMYDSIHILMEGAPANISLPELRAAVMAIDNVVDIHHVHVWMVGENDIHLEAHLNICDMPISKSAAVHDTIEKLLKEKFGIRHITLQFECERCKGIGLIKETIQ